MNTDLLLKLNDLLSSHAFSGAVSGFMVGILLQPLEIIKVCLIVNPTNLALMNTSNFAQSFLLSTRVIYQLEGLKGFWRGLTPALLRIGFANSVYFHFLNIFNRFSKRFDVNQRVNDFFTSSSARVISTYAINPLTILKTRMELPGGHFNYKGVTDALLTIYRKEGLKGFFVGAGACIWRDVPFAGLYYSILNLSREKLSHTGLTPSANTMVSGIVAGLVATSATHPFEVIRTHLQIKGADHKDGKNTKEGIFQSLLDTRNREGLSGLFRGLQARLMRKPLSNALTFTFFELFQAKDQEKKVI